MNSYPKRESYEIIEFIRNIQEGDIITVWFKKSRYEKVKSIKLKITDKSTGNKPLLDAWSLDTDFDKDIKNRDISKHYNLESASQMQSGYLIRNISSEGSIDGSKIVSIK